MHWNWWEAWVYGFVSVLSFVISRLLIARRHPDPIAKRARCMWHEDAQPQIPGLLTPPSRLIALLPLGYCAEQIRLTSIFTKMPTHPIPSFTYPLDGYLPPYWTCCRIPVCQILLTK